MTSVPPPGSFGLTRIRGIKGLAVRAAQLITGDGSAYTHAFLVLDGGQIIEGEPGGAKVRSLAGYLHRQTTDRDVVFSDAPIQRAVAAVAAHPLAHGRPNLEHELAAYEWRLRDHVVTLARSMEHRPYSWLTYLALALLAIGIRPRRLREYVADTGHLICSQLVDEAYFQAGLHLFDDKRAPMDVTPGDLARYRREHRWAEVADEDLDDELGLLSLD